MNENVMQKVKGRVFTLATTLAMVASSFVVNVAPAKAAASLVQNNMVTGTTSTSYNATYSSSTTDDNLLIAVVASRGNSVTAIGTPSGWTQIGATVINGSTPRISQAMFYKIADGTETTVGASFTGAPVTSAISIYEFTGGEFALQDNNFGNDGGSGGTALNAGNITTDEDDELVFVAYAYTNNDGSTTVSSWDGEATSEIYDYHFDSGTNDSSYSVAYDVVNEADGSYNGNATVTGSTRWTGHIAAFTVTTDTTAPVLSAPVAVSTPTTDRTPNFSFSSDEAGTISYDGSCTSAETEAEVGVNQITFSTLSLGGHNDCTLTVTDAALNESDALEIPYFFVSGSGSGGSSESELAITVLTPVGGETFAGGSSTNIVWQHTGGQEVAGVKLLYSTSGGSSWTVLSESENLGSYAWTLPWIGTANAMVRVQALLANNAVGAADDSGAFTITVPEGYPVDTGLPADPGGVAGYVPSAALEASPSINVDKDLPAHDFALCASGSLIKLPSDNNANTTADSTVYYCGSDGKRYVFPNQQTFNSWFADFSSVVVIDAATMSQIALGGNVTYRPGSRMVKLQTDPKVYAVDVGGVLRWVKTEAAALALYGSNWSSFIDDVSDAFMTDYTFGADIE